MASQTALRTDSAARWSSGFSRRCGSCTTKFTKATKIVSLCSLCSSWFPSRPFLRRECSVITHPLRALRLRVNLRALKTRYSVLCTKCLKWQHISTHIYMRETPPKAHKIFCAPREAPVRAEKWPVAACRKALRRNTLRPRRCFPNCPKTARKNLGKSFRRQE